MKSLDNYLFENNSSTLDLSGLNEAIEKLPADNRKVINLHFLQKISRKEIAKKLNWSISKTNQKITRGITLLKAELNPTYFKEMDKALTAFS